MEMTIKEVALLANVSTRTLRYYDQIDLLKPSRVNDAGYRFYTELELDQLQQILTYRKLGLALADIQTILMSPKYDVSIVLKEQERQLLKQRAEIDRSLTMLRHTLKNYQGGITMSQEEKFKYLKETEINANEEKYGPEIRQKYSDEVIDQSNRKYQNLSEADYREMQETEKQLDQLMITYLDEGDDRLRQQICETHKKWLCYTWPSYSKNAHFGLAQMYLADDRFVKYYNNKHHKYAEELVNIISEFTC